MDRLDHLPKFTGVPVAMRRQIGPCMMAHRDCFRFWLVGPEAPVLLCSTRLVMEDSTRQAAPQGEALGEDEAKSYDLQVRFRQVHLLPEVSISSQVAVVAAVKETLWRLPWAGVVMGEEQIKRVQREAMAHRTTMAAVPEAVGPAQTHSSVRVGWVSAISIPTVAQPPVPTEAKWLGVEEAMAIMAMEAVEEVVDLGGAEAEVHYTTVTVAVLVEVVVAPVSLLTLVPELSMLSDTRTTIRAIRIGVATSAPAALPVTVDMAG